MIRNPWAHLSPRAPYVLPLDRPFVDGFNNRASPGVHLDTSLLPEPFVGRPDAPVVLLGLNPGWGPRDAAAHRRSAFRKRVFACLRHEDSDVPFYYLTPGADGPGERWWRKNLRRLLDDVPGGTLARHLLCVEYFPYHSRSFGHAALRLPSQPYSFSLVEAAIRHSAVIIQLRGARYWEGAVPELASYRRRFATHTTRSASISPGNCRDGYPAILGALRDAGA